MISTTPNSSPENTNLKGVINSHLPFDLGQPADRGKISLLLPMGKMLEAYLVNKEKKHVLNLHKNSDK